MRLTSESGGSVRVGPILGQGGEGAVHALEDEAGFVAKLYHKGIDERRLAKLSALVALNSPTLAEAAAWPIAILYSGRTPRGILLPRVHGAHEIHMVYGPAHRHEYFPNNDWSFLARVAANVAAAFDAVHGRGVVVGDVNPSNIMVAKNGSVRFIDCDSFQLVTPRAAYLCEVGVPNFTPPELQGRTFRGLVRTRAHDAFGLALMIFHLLFLGRHPFAGVHAQGDVTLEHAIARGFFAFGRAAARNGVRPPPRSLPLSALPPNLGLLFEEAFAPGGAVERPSAARWHAELKLLLESLVACSNNPAHKYHRGLIGCPWCLLLAQGAPEFFIVVSARTERVNRLLTPPEIERIWQPVTAAAFPSPSFGAAPTAAEPSTFARGERKRVARARWLAFLVGLVGLGLVVAARAVLGAGPIGYGGILMGVAFGVWRIVSVSRTRRRWKLGYLQQAIADARAERALLEDRQLQWLQTQKVNHDKAREQAAAARRELLALEARSMAEHESLERQREWIQREEFLRTRYLAEHPIPKIGPARMAVLLSFGIETAADITPESLESVPGFHRSLADLLLDWRKEQERGFRFDIARPVSEEEKERIERRLLRAQAAAIEVIDKAVAEMRAINGRVNAWHAQQIRRWRDLKAREAQAQVDLTFLS